MNPWPFVVAAYALTALGTLAVLGWAYFSMRASERNEP